MYLKDLVYTTKHLASLDPSHHPKELPSKGPSESLSLRLLACLTIAFPNMVNSEASCFSSLPNGLCALINEEWSVQMTVQYKNLQYWLSLSCLTSECTFVVWIWCKGAPLKTSSYLWSFEDIGKQWDLKMIGPARKSSREMPLKGPYTVVVGLWLILSKVQLQRTRQPVCLAIFLSYQMGFGWVKWYQRTLRLIPRNQGV